MPRHFRTRARRASTHRAIALAIGLTVGLAGSPVRAEENACESISGHIDGQIIGPTTQCGGALTEIGTFTGLGDGTFVACVTSLTQNGNGNGTLVFALQHTYQTTTGDTFTTSDRVVAAPVAPPLYRINNRVDITGGTGALADAFGFITTHGTVNLQTGVVAVDYDGRICIP